MESQGILKVVNIHLYFYSKQHHDDLHSSDQLLPQPSAFTSLIFSLIYLNFTVIEPPTTIFVLSHFSSFLLFMIFRTCKLLVDLAGGGVEI